MNETQNEGHSSRTGSSGLLVGLDIGGTKTAVVLSDDPPCVLGRLAFATEPQRGPRAAWERIVASIHDTLESKGRSRNEIAAIGVSCGGPLDPVRGVIQGPPNLPGWDDVPIKEWLEREYEAPVLLENDANAGALAEFCFGAGCGSLNMIFLTMGTGLGAGLILNGEIYQGSSFLAGEIGHVRLTRSGPSGYGKAGSAEGWASGAGLAKVYQRLLYRQGSVADTKSSSPPTAKDVAEAAERGDPAAQEALALCAQRLGETLAVLLDLLNPDRIVIGGLAMRLGDRFLQRARSFAQKEALPETFGPCTIVPAGLGESIGDIAALCVARQAATKFGSKQLGAIK